MASSSTADERPAADPALSLAIVGGGIAGLLLALSTAEHSPHIALTIYEAAHHFGEIGAGVALSPNSIRALQKIGARVKAGFDNVKTGSADPDKQEQLFVHYVGQSGPNEAARARGVEWDRPAFATSRYHGNAVGLGPGMVHRAAFLDEMVKLVPEGVSVQFGKRLVDLEDRGGDGVHLKFADGTEATHAAVVGCDGIKSRTRVVLLGDDDPAAHAVFTGKYCYRGLIPMDEAVEHIGREAAENATHYFGYHTHMLHFPVQKGKVMNVVAFASRDTWDSPEWVVHANQEEMTADFAGWGDTGKKIIDMMQKPDIWALFQSVPAKTYCKGRICVSGDAAHATTPHQGVGAGMAVEDAYVLSMILQKVRSADNFAVAFAAFDKVRRPRTQRVVQTSYESGKLWEFEDERLGDDLEGIKRELDTHFDWIYEKEIDEDVQAGVEDFEASVKA